jgi:signal transduction histidine kinase/putative methionine-R-sulfoxide reductase with GAF domain
MPSDPSTVAADQSVEELRRELAEARQQQAAAADVLKAISRSAFDLQAVLDTLVQSAANLCRCDDATIFRLEGETLARVAHCGWMKGPSGYVIPAISGTVTGRSAIERRPIHVADLQTASEAYPEGSAIAREFGHHTILAIPLVRQDALLGVISLRRNRIEPFSERQVALVTTFADQAVIAIENTRLFEAEQASKYELQESLERQTATSELLKVIGRSTFDLQPVFEALAQSAVRLCEAERSLIYRLEDDRLRLAASHNATAELIAFIERNPLPLLRTNAAGRASVERRTIFIEDVLSDPEYTYGSTQIDPVRSVLAIPMLKSGELLGVIVINRHQVRPFTASQIALMETFADQAVIAIENARLFAAEQESKRELAEALEYQTATSDVLSVISRSPSQVQPVFDTIAQTARRLCDAERASIWILEDAAYRIAAVDGRRHGDFEQELPQLRLEADRGSITGQVAIDKRVVHVLDLQADPELTVWKGTHIGSHTDFRRTMLGVPLLSQNAVVGVIILARCEVSPFSQKQIDLVSTFADQAVIAVENARLFEEVQARTRELAKTVDDLEIASQHKSQFVANMSHELRTPLAAILGYAELMQEGFYEPLGQKSLDALTRIRGNGKHLLGLINTVLDIAKIESGQFTLNMIEYAIESVVETVRSATESLAQNKKLALKTEVAKSLPIGLGDEQRLTQVLLNLVGNAIKFTDTGEVRVTAKAVDNRFNVSVIDTGPGIPAEHQARIFEQFHQVDSSNTKAKGGTGLGLAIAKQIVEMHGGRIWVESTLGKGSTFQMELPTRAEFWKPTP